MVAAGGPTSLSSRKPSKIFLNESTERISLAANFELANGGTDRKIPQRKL